MPPLIDVSDHAASRYREVVGACATAPSTLAHSEIALLIEAGPIRSAQPSWVADDDDQVPTPGIRYVMVGGDAALVLRVDADQPGTPIVVLTVSCRPSEAARVAGERRERDGRKDASAC